MTPTPHPPLPDELAARVLRGLRSTEPGIGFEDRLLRSLAVAQASTTQTTSARPSLLGRSRRWLPAAAVLSVPTLAVLFLVHRVSLHDRRHREPAAPLAHVISSPAAATQPPSALASVALHRPSRARTPRVTPREYRADTPSVAALEAAAPSQPPPPLPVTTEERQIQRFASRHTAFDLAALAPAAELAHDTAERQAFADFFRPEPAVTRATPTAAVASTPASPSPEPLHPAP